MSNQCRGVRVPSLVGLAGLTAILSGLAPASAGDLPADVAAAIRKEYASPDAETRYRDGAVDLDGDGKPELLVYVLGRMACGTGGCPTLVFTPAGEGYRLVSTIPVSRPPIRVGRERSQGWHDLILEVAGGGTKARTVALRFDGKRYPSNPTVPGPNVVTVKVDGAEVVIADVASFEEATLLPAGGAPTAGAAAMPAGPSFDCAKASTAVEKEVCGDATLAALDRRLADAYAGAMREWPAEEQARQRDAQRKWLAARNACATAKDVDACIAERYRRRLAEVQIQGGLLQVPTPVELACRDHADTPVAVVFFDETDPKSAVVTVGDGQTIAWIAPSASGARYTNDEVELWEHQGETTIVWSGTRYVCTAP